MNNNSQFTSGALRSTTSKAAPAIKTNVEGSGTEVWKPPMIFAYSAAVGGRPMRDTRNRAFPALSFVQVHWNPSWKEWNEGFSEQQFKLTSQVLNVNVVLLSLFGKSKKLRWSENVFFQTRSSCPHSVFPPQDRMSSKYQGDCQPSRVEAWIVSTSRRVHEWKRQLLSGCVLRNGSSRSTRDDLIPIEVILTTECGSASHYSPETPSCL